MKRNNKKTYAEKCGALLDSSIRGARRLEGLGKLSDALGGVIGDALADPDQFRRYIVTEKGRGAEGESFQENVEKIYGKVDFKSVQAAAGAISAVAESIKTVYQIPDFKDISSAAAPQGEPGGAGIRVTFENGEEWGE